MKIWTRGRWLWTRIVGSTLCGELVDSILFYFIAFYGRMPMSHLIAVMFTQYLLKSGWEIIATPVTYRIVSFLKKAENETYYDPHTNLPPSPLKPGGLPPPRRPCAREPSPEARPARHSRPA